MAHDNGPGFDAFDSPRLARLESAGCQLMELGNLTRLEITRRFFGRRSGEHP
jgi:hypothetical protein